LYFLLLFGALTAKHGKKGQKMRCKCKCDAKAVRCNAMGLAESAHAKNFSHYHPWFMLVIRLFDKKYCFFFSSEFIPFLEGFEGGWL
jgi:hypothetical protein